MSFEILIIVALLGAAFLAALTMRNPRGGTARAASFTSIPVLNASEQKLHASLVRAVPEILGPGISILCQVSLGEFLRSKDRSAFMRINAKRADFVLVDAEFRAIATIEFQGMGHSGSTSASARNALERDAVKRQALNSAGIPMIEVPARWKNDDLATLLRPLLPDKA